MAKKTTRRTSKPEGGKGGGTRAPADADLTHIVEDLRPLATPTAALNPDPANARKHSPENLAAIRGSLAQYGQRTPIVVNRKGSVVEKGNGTLAAALALAEHDDRWRHVAVVFVEDDPATQTGYAIADNRTGELAEWDLERLPELLQSMPDDPDLEAELATMFEGLAEDLDLFATEAAADDQDVDPVDLPARFTVFVECPDERTHLALLEELEGRGLKVKGQIS